ncbi:MAG: response regulator, partial [Deltaproteobacteria bacterium]|nr:response regulator [Deltaproteobacteria bacterium]
MTDSKPPRSKILLVDDERSIRVTLGEFLRDSDYEVEVAADATQAKDMLSSENFDVVVTDIVMPRITGVKLLEAIRESSPFVQVILMTGEPTVQTASEAVRAGAFDYLTKPISREELIKTVANAVKVKTLDDERRRLVEENRQY